MASTAILPDGLLPAAAPPRSRTMAAFATVCRRSGRKADRRRRGGQTMAAQSTSRITRVSSPEVPEPAPGTWSNCLVVNGIAYVAGMIARGKDGKMVEGDEYEQAKAIFVKIRNLIE